MRLFGEQESDRLGESEATNAAKQLHMLATCSTSRLYSAQELTLLITITVDDKTCMTTPNDILA